MAETVTTSCLARYATTIKYLIQTMLCTFVKNVTRRCTEKAGKSTKNYLRIILRRRIVKIKLSNGDQINVTKKEWAEIENCNMIVYIKNGVEKTAFINRITKK